MHLIFALKPLPAFYRMPKESNSQNTKNQSCETMVLFNYVKLGFQSDLSIASSPSQIMLLDCDLTCFQYSCPLLNIYKFPEEHLPITLF